MAQAQAVESRTLFAESLVDRRRVAHRQRGRPRPRGDLHGQRVHGPGHDRARLVARALFVGAPCERRRVADHDAAVRLAHGPVRHPPRRAADDVPLRARPLELRALEPRPCLAALFHVRGRLGLRRLHGADRLFEGDHGVVRQGARARARHRHLRRRARHAGPAGARANRHLVLRLAPRLCRDRRVHLAPLLFR